MTTPRRTYEYDEENVNSIEFGAKTTSLDGALAFNVAVFHMDVEGLQLATQIPGTVTRFLRFQRRGLNQPGRGA